jgi:hypothetical protein
MTTYKYCKQAILLGIAIIFALMSATAFAASAAPTASTVLVDGKDTVYDAYNIDDFNYFKLRDLAFSLNGSEKQFEVGWDEANNAISLTSGRPYTVVGGEMTGKGDGAKSASPTDSKVYIDGDEVQFTAYNIDGNNYFKLRDIGEAINFGVDWDDARNTIVIDTGKVYTPAEVTTGQKEKPVEEKTGGNTGGGLGSGPEIKTNYSTAELAKIRSDIEALIQNEPTGGKTITAGELDELLRPYSKSYGDGNTNYYKEMYGHFEKRSAKWSVAENCQISENWSGIPDIMARKSETLHVVYIYAPDMEGTVECSLNTEDDNFYYMYTWLKTKTVGDLYTIEKKPYEEYDYDNKEIDIKVTLYPDAVVDGQECIVYRYQYDKSVTYYWFSKTKGIDILWQYFEDGSQEATAFFTFEEKFIDCDNNFYNPDKQGVTKWNEETSGV